MQPISPTLYLTDVDQLAALVVPFPITEIKTRDQGGTNLKYYEAHTIQQRLLDVLGTGLSIKTGQVIATESNVNMETILEVAWASGKLTITSGWGSADILIGKTGKIVNDPYKTAATDSIKVAASKLGVAQELYDSKYREGLAVRLKELEDQEAEKALLTCQGCQGEITGGSFVKADGSVLTLTAKEVAISTRKKFTRRFCMVCAGQEGKKADSKAIGSPFAAQNVPAPLMAVHKVNAAEEEIDY